MAVTETIWPTEPKIFTILSSEREWKAPNPGLGGTYPVHSFLTLQLVTHRLVCSSSVECGGMCLRFPSIVRKCVNTALHSIYSPQSTVQVCTVIVAWYRLGY